MIAFCKKIQIMNELPYAKNFDIVEFILSQLGLKGVVHFGIDLRIAMLYFVCKNVIQYCNLDVHKDRLQQLLQSLSVLNNEFSINLENSQITKWEDFILMLLLVVNRLIEIKTNNYLKLTTKKENKL